MSVKDVDSHKLGYHPERVVEWKQNGICFPLHIEVGLTNKCNHACIQCTLDWINHKSDIIETEVFLKTLEDAAKMGVKSIYFAGEGEPTLHKDLPLFVKKAYDLGMKISLATNGSKLDREMSEKIMPYLSWIRFSVDAATKETFSKIHRVGINEFDKVVDNIKTCIEVNGSGCQVGIQTLLMPENVHEIEDLAKMSKEWGAHNIQVKPAHTHPKSSYQAGIYLYSQEELQTRLETLSDENFTAIVRLKSMERLLEPRTYRECHAFHFYCLIDAYGQVTPCNIFYSDPEFIFGNIHEESLTDIWMGDKKKEVIEKITETNHSRCDEYRCRQDVMNRYLERVKNPELNDEFI
jgi:radical SAM protein with 4Fe4S-binding SPASM domain